MLSGGPSGIQRKNHIIDRNDILVAESISKLKMNQLKSSPVILELKVYIGFFIFNNLGNPRLFGSCVEWFQYRAITKLFRNYISSVLHSKQPYLSEKICSTTGAANSFQSVGKGCDNEWFSKIGNPHGNPGLILKGFKNRHRLQFCDKFIYYVPFRVSSKRALRQCYSLFVVRLQKRRYIYKLGKQYNQQFVSKISESFKQNESNFVSYRDLVSIQCK